MEKKTPKLFSCSQAALYAVVLMALGYVKQHLAKFSAFKAFYTDTYIDNLEKQAKAASKLLNEQQRNAITSANRDVAETSVAVALKAFRSLRQYINSAFKGNILKAKLNEAGKAYYSEAAEMQWDAIVTMLEMGVDFLEANEIALLANNNMPKDFKDTYNTVAEECIKLIKGFQKSATDKGSLTLDKTKADNDLYTTTIAILKDGQHIFEEQKSILRLFVFNTLLNIVKSKMPSHFTGFVLDANNRPIVGATISVNGDYSAVTNAKGRFEINRLQGGQTYPVTVVRSGFEVVELNVTFKAGTGKHIKFKLVPDMQVVKPNESEGNGMEKVA